MTHTYTITGMTCNGCRTSVEDTLNAINGVSKASVYLEKEQAEITMKHPIAIETLQKALPAKYTIFETASATSHGTEREATNVFETTSVSEEKTKLQQLKPLFLIFGYLLGATFLLHFKNWNTSEAMLDFMGLFFIVFSFFKFLDLKGFTESFSMYDPLAKAVPKYGWVYPFIETALGILFLMRLEVEVALVVTLVVLGITTVGVTRTILSKKAIQCACLGTALKLPMTEATFIENSSMIVMAIVLLLNIYL